MLGLETRGPRRGAKSQVDERQAKTRGGLSRLGAPSSEEQAKTEHVFARENAIILSTGKDPAGLRPRRHCRQVWAKTGRILAHINAVTRIRMGEDQAGLRPLKTSSDEDKQAKTTRVLACRKEVLDRTGEGQRLKRASVLEVKTKRR